MGELIDNTSCYGGGGRIRTHGTREGTTVFKTAAFNHSATPPLSPIIYRFSSRSGESGGLARRATGGRRRRTLTVRRGGRRSATQSGRVLSSLRSDEGGNAAVEDLGIVRAG